MITAPRVSIILPSYNRLHTLPAAISSILGQTFSEFELIVVNDGSTDNTVEYVTALNDPRVVLVSLDKNSGVAAARNAGLNKARGELVAFQDSDDEWLLDKLAKQIAHLEKQPANILGIACGIVRYAENGLMNDFSQLCMNRDKLKHEEVLVANCIYTQTWLMPRKLLQDLGGFDEAMGIWDDWELLIRISRHTEISLMPDYLVVSGRCEDSLSAVNPKWIPDLQHILAKHHQHLQAWPKQHGRLHHLLARRHTQRQQWVLARTQFRHALACYPWVLKRWLLVGLICVPSLANRLLNRA
ncbi:MAG: glycosyltransferase family 2 protein [Oceanococcus sp.]